MSVWTMAIAAATSAVAAPTMAMAWSTSGARSNSTAFRAMM